MRILPFLLFALACGGSGDDSGSTATNPDYPPSMPLQVSYTECSVAEDCVAVELGCCDACNGGFAVAVNTASADKVAQQFTETCGANWACTEMACPSWVLSCDAGTCAMERGTF